MLSTGELQAHLDRLSYKQGWTFKLYQGRWEGTHLSITFPVEDSTKPGETLDIGVECFVPPIPSTVYFEHWLADRLARIEVHEMREFLKRDGHVIFDPHEPFADRDLA